MPALADHPFANDRDIQRERLMLLARLLDPGTFRLLEALDVGAGMTCVEIGAGGGSVADWLGRRASPGGSVLATDLDTLPEQEFDLVHARLLLARLPDPGAGLRRLLAALKPGGCLLLEEFDFISFTPDPGLEPTIRAFFSRLIDAQNAMFAGPHSCDPHYGRRLAGELGAAGLVKTGCEGRAAIWHGGQAGGRFWQLTLLQQRPTIIASGLATAREVDVALARCADPKLHFLSPMTVAAWGFRPLAASRRAGTLGRI